MKKENVQGVIQKKRANRSGTNHQRLQPKESLHSSNNNSQSSSRTARGREQSILMTASSCRIRSWFRKKSFQENKRWVIMKNGTRQRKINCTQGATPRKQTTELMVFKMPNRSRNRKLYARRKSKWESNLKAFLVSIIKIPKWFL